MFVLDVSESGGAAELESDLKTEKIVNQDTRLLDSIEERVWSCRNPRVGSHRTLTYLAKPDNSIPTLVEKDPPALGTGEEPAETGQGAGLDEFSPGSRCRGDCSTLDPVGAPSCHMLYAASYSGDEHSAGFQISPFSSDSRVGWRPEAEISDMKLAEIERVPLLGSGTTRDNSSSHLPVSDPSNLHGATPSSIEQGNDQTVTGCSAAELLFVSDFCSYIYNYLKPGYTRCTSTCSSEPDYRTRSAPHRRSRRRSWHGNLLLLSSLLLLHCNLAIAAPPPPLEPTGTILTKL